MGWGRDALPQLLSRRSRSPPVVLATPLRKIELLTGVLAEVGLEEGGRLRHRDADVGQILHLHPEVHSVAVQEMPAPGTILGHEVEVPTCDEIGRASCRERV